MVKSLKNIISVVLISGALFGTSASAQQLTKLTLRLDQQGVPASPMLYGLMTEEINYAYDGGIYAELIRNRSFKDNYKNPDHWTLIKSDADSSEIALDNKHPVNEALTISLRLHQKADGKHTALANDGFWGIPVLPSTLYKGSFYAMTDNSSAGPVTVSIESTDGKTIFATADVSGLAGSWKKFTFKFFTTASAVPTAATRFVIRPPGKGNYWFTLVSLFPPTYVNTANGNRRDIMQLLAAMHPEFLRLPGGNYLEGGMFSTRYNWKKTLGPIDHRPGHQGTWGYRSSDGMGLLEYLEWCEDLMTTWRRDPYYSLTWKKRWKKLSMLPAIPVQPMDGNAPATGIRPHSHSIMWRLAMRMASTCRGAITAGLPSSSMQSAPSTLI